MTRYHSLLGSTPAQPSWNSEEQFKSYAEIVIAFSYVLCDAHGGQSLAQASIRSRSRPHPFAEFSIRLIAKVLKLMQCADVENVGPLGPP